MNEYRIGVAGFSAQKFDEDVAIKLLDASYDIMEIKHSGASFIIVSGLTDLGVPGLAYRLAVDRGWKTSGVACSKAYRFECFPVNETIIVGDDWGDESETFIDTIDALICVGGGDQTRREEQMTRDMGKFVLVHYLPAQ